MKRQLRVGRCTCLCTCLCIWHVTFSDPRRSTFGAADLAKLQTNVDPRRQTLAPPRRQQLPGPTQQPTVLNASTVQSLRRFGLPSVQLQASTADHASQLHASTAGHAPAAREQRPNYMRPTTAFSNRKHPVVRYIYVTHSVC